MLLSVGTFGISFVVRPLGAVILGSYADRAGRKASLTVSILIMMLGTAMIAFAPTYAQIGIWSPLIIIVARLLQGFSTGGEFGAATAGVSALLRFYLTQSQLNDWGWRIAFCFGLLVGPVGIYIRSQIAETPEFSKVMADKAAKATNNLTGKNTETEKSPLLEVLVRDRVKLLLGIGVVSGATAFNYVHKLYMPTYALKQLHIPATSSFIGALVTGLVLMLTAPLFGSLSDRYGRFRVLTMALVMIGLTSYPLFMLLNVWPTVTMLIVVQGLVGLLIAACLGPIPAMLSDIFPTQTRGTGLALSYNFSVTLFGGFSPLIVTWMIAATDNKMAPSFYVMTTALISVVAVIALGRRMRRAGAN